VIGFCVTSSGALPNSASNSLRSVQALANRRLLESSDLELLRRWTMELIASAGMVESRLSKIFRSKAIRTPLCNRNL
jgi:hypothetical protein